MRKKVLTIVLLVVANAIFAQNPIGKGQSQFNAGVGLSSWGVPVYFGLDYGVHKDISIGGEVSFRSYHDNYSGERYNHSVAGISGNGNFHFNNALNIPSNWDFYAGLNLGFQIYQ